MDDRELLDRLRALVVEMDRLIEGAESNSKYYTKARLVKARAELVDAGGSLAWHVESGRG
jgi:hypothetical protein